MNIIKTLSLPFSQHFHYLMLLDGKFCDYIDFHFYVMPLYELLLCAVAAFTLIWRHPAQTFQVQPKIEVGIFM